MIDNLKANKPMLHCNLTHAMVLFQVNYTPFGAVGAAVVIDPMPGMGVRQLTQLEMVPANQFVPSAFGPVRGQFRMLAVVDVT